MDEHARVEVAAPRTHHEPAGRGEAHRSVEADATPHGCKACTVAQMRDDDAAIGLRRVRGAQLLHDVLAGKAVETVAEDASLGKAARQRVEPGDAGHPAVECCVEAGYLRHGGVCSGCGFYGRERLGHVLRIDLRQPLQVFGYLGVDEPRFAIAVPTMHDPVP